MWKSTTFFTILGGLCTLFVSPVAGAANTVQWDDMFQNPANRKLDAAVNDTITFNWGASANDVMKLDACDGTSYLYTDSDDHTLCSVDRNGTVVATQTQSGYTYTISTADSDKLVCFISTKGATPRSRCIAGQFLTVKVGSPTMPVTTTTTTTTTITAAPSSSAFGLAGKENNTLWTTIGSGIFTVVLMLGMLGSVSSSVVQPW